MVYFDKNSLGFYDDSLKDSYTTAGSWPDDMVEVSEEDHKIFMAGKKGYRIGSNKKGQPTWIKVTQSKEEKQQELSEAVKIKIQEAMLSLSPLQYAVDLDIASDEEKNSLNELKTYIVNLNRLSSQGKGVDEVEWPTAPQTK